MRPHRRSDQNHQWSSSQPDQRTPTLDDRPEVLTSCPKIGQRPLADAYGDFAEDLVRKYFEDAGFAMIRVGVEHIFGDWLDALIADDKAIGDNRSRTSQICHFTEQRKLVTLIRHAPDFIAIRRMPREDGVREIFPVEVKYRRERQFVDNNSTLTAIRLSDRSVFSYQEFWPATLLVVVCHDARQIIATRIVKLSRRPDRRVPIREYRQRQSWFYDVRRHGFVPLWHFTLADFDEEQGRALAGEVAEWADTVWSDRYGRLLPVSELSSSVTSSGPG